MALALPSRHAESPDLGADTGDDRDVMPIDRLIQLVDHLRGLAASLDERCLRLDLRLSDQEELLRRVEALLNSRETPASAGTTAANSAEGESGAEPACGLETMSFLRGWQQQRSEMLDRMSRQEAADHEEEPKTPTSEDPGASATANALLEASEDDRNEIQRLKDQLQQAMRDAEIELARERARLSNERLELERRDAEWKAREKELLKQLQSRSTPQQRDGGMSRLKRLLGGKSGS